VFLDTLGFSGFNTAMQAIECGLPIVTRAGRFMRGRLARGILERVGVPELVAASDTEYVELAVRLVNDRSWNATLRDRLSRAVPAVRDDLTSIRALERFLVEAVRRSRQSRAV
jgi:predicted O-linked N-acetylglucosamine transferase (SPINDLY family)